ncbi:MAG: hypothetical protein ACXWMH_08740 [Syntrophales bacterium]
MKTILDEGGGEKGVRERVMIAPVETIRFTPVGGLMHLKEQGVALGR